MTKACEFCLESFASTYQVSKHQQKSKTCFKYKHNLFFCTKCDFTTKGIKNIEAHNDTCVATTGRTPQTKPDLEREFDEQYQMFCEERRLFRIKIKLQEQERQLLENDRITLHEERQLLDVDRIKLQEERQLLDKDMMKLQEERRVFDEDKMKYEETKDIKYFKTLYLLEQSKNNTLMSFIDQTLHTTSSESDIKLAVVTQEKEKKSSYKSMTKFIEVKNVVNDDKFIIEEEEEKKEEEQVKKYISLNEAQIIFKEYFEKLKTGRIYSNELKVIKETRYKLFGSITLAEYETLLKEHIEIISKIFQDKNYAEKKLQSMIFSSLNPVDSRMLFYGPYVTLSIANDEVAKFIRCIKISNIQPKQFVPFNFDMFIRSMLNYSSVIIDLKELIERNIFNYHGFFNVVYVPIKQSSDDDPYSFYVLHSTNKDKLYWHMDCRLEDLSNNIINTLRPYLVQTFRKIYYDIFHDNDYRPNYVASNMQGSNIIECDCEQLLLNILLLSQQQKFCKMLRNIIKGKATYISSDKDKFNLYGDDAIQKKRLSTSRDNSDDMVDIMKQLFDKITSEQAINFYKTKNI